MWLEAHLPIRRGSRSASCERLSEGFMARVFESRHRYFHLNIGLARCTMHRSLHFTFFLLIAIGKFASDPHDLVTTGPLAPSPATGINNQTPPCEILNSLFDCIVDFI